jgi:hypothetical protein
MSAFTLLVGQLLPWGVGSAMLACLLRDAGTGRGALIAGYGYLAGSFALTLWMRALSTLGVPFGWASIALPLLIAALAALWPVRGRLRTQWAWRGPAIEGEHARLRASLWWLLALLVAAHLGFAALEIMWRPLFPWDAWSQWATKAHVWYALGYMAPFADANAWWGGVTYLDTAPNYPANMPLLQVWSSIAFGRWDDSMINWPWWSFALALALVFYGQLRQRGRGPLFAMVGTYLVVSMPLLDTHVALAGYADLPLAAYYGASAIAAWQWANARDSRQGVLALVMAAACPLTKIPGWVWLLTLLPALIVALMPRRGLRVVLGLWGLGAMVLLVLAQFDFVVTGYRLHADFRPVWEPLWENYYELANWHLLWYLLPLLALATHRRLIAPPLLAGTVMVASGLAFLFVVFSFTSASQWVQDFSTVNRATLHLAPLLMFFVLMMVEAIVRSLREKDPAPAAVPA